MKIAKETWVIMAIGMADLATTIIFIQHQGAQEANPLFKRYWEMGLAVFIAAKLAFLVGPLSVLEWARHRNPRFVAWALRGAIAAYLAMYGVGYARLNNAPRTDRDLIVIAPPPLRLSGPFAGRMHPMVPGRPQTTDELGADASSEAVTAY